MRKAFYRQYRPKKLSEVVGQDHITTTLSNAVKTGNISHAYLLTGPRGVGKTSVARILAHEINELTYEDSQTHLDIIEIDAASNRRIDEIRDLRDKVHIAPTSAKYKVYIIDEVHMLTREAFNALLKTLEEPPEHVVFILATTEPHKVPETIISRTQQFSFKSVTEELVAKQLQEIAKLEGIKLDNEAARLIAAHGNGSFRDSISLLDQLSNSDKTINNDAVRLVVGLPDTDQLESLVKSVLDNRVDKIVEQLQVFRSHGVSSAMLSKQLTARLRSELLNPNSTVLKQGLLGLIESLMYVSVSSDQAMALEVALLKYVLAGTPETTSEQKHKGASQSVIDPEPTPASDAPIIEPVAKSSQPKEEVTPPNTNEQSADPWRNVLQSAKRQHNSLYGVLRMAQVTTSDTKLTIGFKFPFHVKQVLQAKNLDKVNELVKANFRGPMKVTVTIAENYQEPLHTLSPDQEKKHGQPETSDPAIASLSNIFGSVELLD